MSTLFRNGNLFCDNCGGKFELKFPISIDDMKKRTDAFAALHADCEKTWEEPKVDPNLSELGRAEWWWQNGERGLSSESIWNFMKGKWSGGPLNHPWDPDDFRRCRNLLNVMPEWRSRIAEMGTVSPIWSRLVDRWDELEALLLQAEGGDEKRSGEMYAIMQTLIGK